MSKQPGIITAHAQLLKSFCFLLLLPNLTSSSKIEIDNIATILSCHLVNKKKITFLFIWSK